MPNLKEIIGDWSFMKKIDAVPSDSPFAPKPIDFISAFTERLREGESIPSNEFPKYFKDGHVFLDEQSLPFVLYISDQNRLPPRFPYWPRGWIKPHKRHEYKFHFRWCQTLKQMDNQGKIERYRAKYDICDPVFKVNDNKNNAQLKVCLNCCNNFRRKGKTVYAFFNARRDNIEKEFDMPSFFEEFGIIDLPRSKHPGGPDTYLANWSEISRQERDKVNWQCQDPNHIGDRNFRNDTKNLHVHHKNGVKSHNVSDNLEVLCRTCHARRHPHMQP